MTIEALPEVSEDQPQEHVMKIDLRKIIVLPGRGRKDFNKVPQLAESIRAIGRLIHPIVVKPSTSKPDHWEIIAGERRYRAHLLLAMQYPKEWMTIDCIDRKFVDELLLKEVELEENLQREALSWPEQCELTRQIDEIKRLRYGEKLPGQQQGEGWTVQKTADALSQPKSTTARQIQVAKKLKERPDIAAKVASLPMNVAIKEIERIEGAERVARMAQQGTLVLSDQLVHGSCVDKLKDVPADSIDMVDIDPPFGIPVLDDLEGELRGETKSYTSVLKPDDNGDVEGVQKLMTQVHPELYRVMKPSAHGFMFFAFELYDFLVNDLKKNGFEVDPVPIIWYKGRTTSGFMGYWGAPCYEPILHFIKPPVTKRLHEPLKKIIEFAPPPRAIKSHPFQKPEELHTHLIKLATNVGDKVLDCFAGSGSTLHAAIKSGRCAYGIEKDYERYLDAQRRLHELKNPEEAAS